MNQAARREPQKRLPPYSERVEASRAVWVSAGPDAWERAKRWQWEGDPGLVHPPDADPFAFLWPVEGMSVLLIALDMPQEQLGRLIAAIALHRPAVIACLYGPPDNDQIEILVPGRDI